MTHPLRTSRDGLRLIQDHEGFVETAQPIGEGRYLVGFGHTRLARKGHRLSRREAELLLQKVDLPPIERALSALVLAPLAQNEFDALVSFAFNIGTRKFAESQVLEHLNAGDKIAAAEAMSRWRRAKVRDRVMMMDALVRRRIAESALFLNGSRGPMACPSPLYRPQEDAARERADTDTPAHDTDARACERDLAPTAPEIAAEQVSRRFERIFDDTQSATRPADAKPEAPRPPAPPPEPTVDEITAAVSALAEPDDTPDTPRPAIVPSGAERARPDIDDLEPVEDVMERIRRDLKEGQIPAGEVAPGSTSSRTVMPWLALGGVGALATGWGIADRMGVLPANATLTGTGLDLLPVLFILLGVMVLIASMLFLARDSFVPED